MLCFLRFLLLIRFPLKVDHSSKGGRADCVGRASDQGIRISEIEPRLDTNSHESVLRLRSSWFSLFAPGKPSNSCPFEDRGSQVCAWGVGEGNARGLVWCGRGWRTKACASMPGSGRGTFRGPIGHGSRPAPENGRRNEWSQAKWRRRCFEKASSGRTSRTRNKEKKARFRPCCGVGRTLW